MSADRYITLSEDWDELTEADWREVLKIRHMVATTDHQWTVDDVRIESARAMLKNRGVRQQLDNPQWLVLVSQLDAETVRRCNMIPAATPDEALAIARQIKGEDARVVVIPDGVSVLAVAQ